MTTLHFNHLTAGIVPHELSNHMSPGAWTTFYIEAEKAKKDVCLKACMLECGFFICFGCICVFCFHPCIQTGMGKSKLDG